MSYSNPPSRWTPVKEALGENLPRILLISGLALAWSLTLAWPQASLFGDAPAWTRDAVADGSRYPLRLALPGAKPATEDQIVAILGPGALPGPKASEPVPILAMEPPVRNEPEIEGESLAIAPKPQPSIALEPDEFMPLTYELGDIASLGNSSTLGGAGALDLNIDLVVDGQNQGKASFRVEDGAQILISASSARKAFGTKGQQLPSRIAKALATGTGYIPFYELRSAGIEVEYDPVKDVVSITSPE